MRSSMRSLFQLRHHGTLLCRRQYLVMGAVTLIEPNVTALVWIHDACAIGRYGFQVPV